MISRTSLKRSALRALSDTYIRFPLPGVRRPVFILGCGRSGTTVFGTALGKHRRVTYLNERRDLWFDAYPQTDIWTEHAVRRNGLLWLDASHVDPRKSHRLSRSFLLETVKTGRPVLVEKLPINNFRLGLISRTFPDARFIHIFRNGFEVARSIEKLSRKGKWFGNQSYKWDRLVDFASGDPSTSGLPALTRTPFEKGLLEWRLSTEAAVRFLAPMPAGSFFEVSYDNLVADPSGTLGKVLAFLDLDFDPAVRRFASEYIRRRSTPIIPDEVPDTARAIGGDLLELSLHAKGGLTERYAASKREGVARLSGEARGARGN